MGFLDRIIGKSGITGQSEDVNWVQLEDLQQLDEIVVKSEVSNVIIVKHSTRCSISSMVLNRFEEQYDLTKDELQPYFLDLIKYREISNAIVSRFEIVHQSPQILLIQKGKCTYHSSHDGIDLSHLKSML